MDYVRSRREIQSIRARRREKAGTAKDRGWNENSKSLSDGDRRRNVTSHREKQENPGAILGFLTVGRRDSRENNSLSLVFLRRKFFNGTYSIKFELGCPTFLFTLRYI